MGKNIWLLGILCFAILGIFGGVRYFNADKRASAGIESESNIIVHDRGNYPGTKQLLAKRKNAQFETLDTFKVFYDFKFEDQIEKSNITFIHKIVDDAGKYYKAIHYDHGNGVAVADIDNDGKLEYITAYWYESQLKQVPFIKIYDDDGTDITDTWLGDKYMDTSKKHGGGGVNVVDINNDGYIDIIPRDGWNYFRDSHSPNMGDFTDKTRGTFGIFLNDGTKFNQYNLDFRDFNGGEAWLKHGQDYPYGQGWQGQRHVIDIDNDGFYELLIIDDWYQPRKMDILTLDYKNRIDDLSDVSIKEDSIKVIKLSAADLKGGTISYSAKSSENNVTVAISNDTLTLTPALNAGVSH